MHISCHPFQPIVTRPPGPFSAPCTPVRPAYRLISSRRWKCQDVSCPHPSSSSSRFHASWLPPLPLPPPPEGDKVAVQSKIVWRGRRVFFLSQKLLTPGMLIGRKRFNVVPLRLTSASRGFNATTMIADGAVCYYLSGIAVNCAQKIDDSTGGCRLYGWSSMI